MTDDPTANDHDMACLHVGRFMNHFALLEGAVNNGIGKLLGLKGLEESIATSNMQFRAKIHILKTVVNLNGGREDWLKTLREIDDLSNTRNIIAHNIFGPDEGGVRFLTVKAKGKLTFPKTIYSDEDFARLWATSRNLRERMEEITEGLSPKPRGLFGALGTTQPNALLGLDNPPSPKPQAGQKPPKPNRKNPLEKAQD